MLVLKSVEFMSWLYQHLVLLCIWLHWFRSRSHCTCIVVSLTSLPCSFLFQRSVARCWCSLPGFDCTDR